jgi:hypothetical protein
MRKTVEEFGLLMPVNNAGVALFAPITDET